MHHEERGCGAVDALVRQARGTRAQLDSPPSEGASPEAKRVWIFCDPYLESTPLAAQGKRLVCTGLNLTGNEMATEMLNGDCATFIAIYGR